MAKLDQHVKDCFEKAQNFLSQYREANIPEDETFILQRRNDNESINDFKIQLQRLVSDLDDLVIYMNANYFKNQLDDPQYRQNVTDILKLGTAIMDFKQTMFKNLTLTSGQDEDTIDCILGTGVKQIISLLTTNPSNKLKHRIVSLTRKSRSTLS